MVLMMMMTMLIFVEPYWAACYPVAAPESIWCSPLCPPPFYHVKQPIYCSTSYTSSPYTNILHLKVFGVPLCVLPSQAASTCSK